MTGEIDKGYNPIKWPLALFGLVDIILAITSLTTCVFALGNSSESASIDKQVQGYKPPIVRTAAVVDPNTPEGHKVDVTEGKAFLRSITTVGLSCDKAFRLTNASIAANDMLALYRNAQYGESVCLQAFEALNRISVPPHATDQAQDGMRESLTDLHIVYSDERDLMARLAGFANNPDAGPAAIASYQDDFSHVLAMKNRAAQEAADALGSEKAVSGVQLRRHKHHN